MRFPKQKIQMLGRRITHMKALSDLLEKYNIEPKAYLDQHFLINERIIDKIISLLDIKKNDVIIEIGAGIGNITKKIRGCKKLIAIEIDKNLFKILSNEVKENKNIELVNDNALKIINNINFNKIISSTPYAICEPLMQKLFFLDFEKAILLLPKNFVDNVRNKKTKLGFLADAFFDIKIIGNIDRNDFYPIPKVETVIAVVTKNKKDSLIKQLYLQRDKKLKNALLNIFINYKITKKQAKEKIKNIGIDQKILDKRVEKLNKEDYEEVIKKHS